MIPTTRDLDPESEEYRKLMDKTFRHDLKNLLNLTQGYSKLLEQPLPEQKEELYQEKIEETEERIELLYSKFENQGEEYNANFQELIGDSLEMLRPKIQKNNKNVSINWDLEANNSEYDLLVERMVYNLLDNSLEHGRGDIQIEIEENDDYLQMDVYDGGGLNNNEWDQILAGEEMEDDYLSTGSYLIDQIAQKEDIEINHRLSTDYTVNIPKN